MHLKRKCNDVARPQRRESRRGFNQNHAYDEGLGLPDARSFLHLGEAFAEADTTRHPASAGPP
jgi:hypothetical protein